MALGGLPIKLLKQLVSKNSTKEVKVEVAHFLAEMGTLVLYISSLNLATSQGTQTFCDKCKI